MLHHHQCSNRGIQAFLSDHISSDILPRKNMGHNESSHLNTFSGGAKREKKPKVNQNLNVCSYSVFYSRLGGEDIFYHLKHIASCQKYQIASCYQVTSYIHTHTKQVTHFPVQTQLLKTFWNGLGDCLRKPETQEVRKNNLASFLLKRLEVVYPGILYLPSSTRSKNTAVACWFICAEIFSYIWQVMTCRII